MSDTPTESTGAASSRDSTRAPGSAPYSVEQLPPLGNGHGLATGTQSLRLTGLIHGRRAVIDVRYNMESLCLFRFDCEIEDASEGMPQWIGHASGSIGATDDITVAADTAWRLCENYAYRRGQPYVLNREVTIGPCEPNAEISNGGTPATKSNESN